MNNHNIEKALIEKLIAVCPAIEEEVGQALMLEGEMHRLNPHEDRYLDMQDHYNEHCKVIGWMIMEELS